MEVVTRVVHWEMWSLLVTQSPTVSANFTLPSPVSFFLQSYLTMFVDLGYIILVVTPPCLLGLHGLAPSLALSGSFLVLVKLKGPNFYILRKTVLLHTLNMSSGGDIF